MTWFNKLKNSFNFLAPEIADGEQVNEVMFPFVNTQTIAGAAIISIPAAAKTEVVKIQPLTGDTEVQAAVDSGVQEGAEMVLLVTDSGAANTISFTTGFSAPNVTLVASKTNLMKFIFLGASYSLVSNQQLD